MINPGTTRSIPTSSNVGLNNTGLGKSVLKLDGFTLTIGMVLALILAFLIWQTFFAKRRR